LLFTLPLRDFISSTGLDAAATFNIVRALKEWATVTRGSATMALLQPAPEVVALFDRVILMREGHVVFAGSHAQLDAFLAASGVAPPPGKDKADWLVDWLAHPKAVYERDCAKQQAPLEKAGINKQDAAETHAPAQPPLTDVTTVRFHIDADERPAHVAAVEMQQLGQPKAAPALSPSGPALTTAGMLRVFHASEAYLDLQAEVASSRTALSQGGSATAGAARSAFTTAQFCTPTPHGFWHHASSNISREWTSSMRNEDVLYYRVGQAIFMGLIIGSLFFDLGTQASDVTNRLGLVFLVIMLIAFSSMAEVPLAAENKLVSAAKRSDEQHACALTRTRASTRTRARTHSPRVHLTSGFHFPPVICLVAPFCCAVGDLQAWRRRLVLDAIVRAERDAGVHPDRRGGGGAPRFDRVLHDQLRGVGGQFFLLPPGAHRGQSGHVGLLSHRGIPGAVDGRGHDHHQPDHGSADALRRLLPHARQDQGLADLAVLEQPLHLQRDVDRAQRVPVAALQRR
jgi:hypothetical protein